MSQIFRKVRILYWMLMDVVRAWREDVLRKDLDGTYCCNGRECGCGGSSLGDVYGEWEHKNGRPQA